MKKIHLLGMITALCLLKNVLFAMSQESNHITYTIADGVNIHLITSDITELKVDAIVNAANEHLRGGGGIDGAIHTAAGPELAKYNEDNFAEVTANVRCPMGQVKVSPSFNLAEKGISYIFSTNGPRGSTENRANLLAQCYQNAIIEAHKQQNLKKVVPSGNGIIRSMAFPAISIGIFNYPLEEATQIAVTSLNRAICEKKQKNELTITDLYLVIYDSNINKQAELFDTYEKQMDKNFQGKVVIKKSPACSLLSSEPATPKVQPPAIISSALMPSPITQKPHITPQVHKSDNKKTLCWNLGKSTAVGLLSAIVGYVIGKKMHRPFLTASVVGFLGAGLTWLIVRYGPFNQRNNTSS